MRRDDRGDGAPWSDLAALLEPTREGASVERRLLWRCARVTLSDAALAEVRQLGAWLDADGWGRVVALAEREGVDNLLFTHICAAGLATTLPAAVALRLRERYCAITLLARRLERRLEALMSLLAAEGTPAIPLKGASLARRAYGGAISLRPVTDIDLLVRREDEQRWSATFRAAGFAPVAGRGDAMSAHALRFHETQFRDSRGLLLEAHTSLCRLPPYRGAFPLAEMWARARRTTIQGVPACTLAPDDELRYLSLHYAALHQASRLIWLVDVAELLRAQGATWSWERFVRETVLRGVAAPVAITLARAATLLEAPVPRWVVERLNAAALTRAERQAWADAHAPMDDWRRFLAQTLALDTAAGRLRLLRSGGASLSRRVRARLTELAES
ncbi:MAG TPA: nucleotidyltransferase family protein [Ktedonobacterales bacterium]|nr:nucleotidyltransferase family protein [Ktedonobacterales bacterium]